MNLANEKRRLSALSHNSVRTIDSMQAGVDLSWSGATDVSLLWDIARGSYARSN